MTDQKKRKTKVIYVKVPGFNQFKRKVVLVPNGKAEGLEEAKNYKVKIKDRIVF